jgi:hypothetical protein
VDLEVWLLLGYAIMVLAGARLTEALARTHFRRARRSAEQGFHYDQDGDHYHCPHGERLSLHVIDSNARVAVYRAPASSCADCPSKAACTPHDEGRHIYRPLAEWAETDVGRFHQWLSIFMAGSATALSLVAIVRFAARPGIGVGLRRVTNGGLAEFATTLKSGIRHWALFRAEAEAEKREAP